MKNLFKHKNNIILGIIFCMMFTLLFHHYNSNTYAQNIGCGIVTLDADIEIMDTVMNNDATITKFSDGSILTEFVDGSFELNIPLVSPFFSEEERESIVNDGRRISFVAMAKIFLEIVGGVFTACSVIEWLTNYQFDPCKVARQYLGSNAQTGRYVVEGNYIPGQVPGCEPMHSLPCNSGYYQYRFIPD